MTKLYSFLAFLCLFLFQLPESFAQKRKNASKDTLIVVYCSSLPGDLNSLATYQAAQKNLNVDDPDRFYIENKQLTGPQFTPAALQNTVEEIGKRGKSTRVLFHFFDHGQNTGGKLPALVSPYAPAPGLIDIEKTVVNPLQSKVEFLLVLVDACNEISDEVIQKDPPGATNTADKQLTPEEYVKFKAGKNTLKETKVDRKYRKEPLGLLFSSKGWLAIGTSSEGQKAWAPKSVGGVGSFWFFDLLATADEKVKNWPVFLETYKQTLESGDSRHKQTPAWAGKVNEKFLSTSDNLALKKLDKDAAEGLLRNEYKNMSYENAINEGQSTTKQFCKLVDNLYDGMYKIPDQLVGICVQPDKFLIFDDLSIAMNEPKGSNYVKLENYRSSRKKWGTFKSWYIADSLRMDGTFEDTVRHVMFMSFLSVKRVERPNATTDTLFRQHIYVEVQPDPNLGQRFLNLFRPDKPQILVHRVSNISGAGLPAVKPVIKDSAQTSKGDPSKDFKLPAPIDFYKSHSNDLIKSAFDLIEQAANNYDTPGAEAAVLEKAKSLFMNPGLDTFQVSRLNRNPKTLSPAADGYFKRFWTDYREQYDSVHYSFVQQQLLPMGNTDFLQQIAPDKWKGRIEFEQIFRGYNKKKVCTYADITKKQATIWLTLIPAAAGKPAYYDLRLGSVVVTEIKPYPKK